MGNRGGRIHDPLSRQLLGRRWASKRWICCLTKFKSRQRTVMGKGYTELFFLDEVSAFASGHRPCFECRRSDAKNFAAHWASALNLPAPPAADYMDHVLHEQRLGERQTVEQNKIRNFPDGVMFEAFGMIFAKRNDRLVRWSGEGYSEHDDVLPRALVQLTPEIVVSVFRNGYQAKWYSEVKARDQHVNT